MRKYRPEKTDLKVLKVRASKEKNVRHKVEFSCANEFLNFVTAKKPVKNEDFPRLLAIIEALEFQPFKGIQGISDELFYRNTDLIVFHDDYRVRAACIRVLTLLLTDIDKFIRVIQNNQDVIFFRILYTSEFHIAERVEVLHFLATFFSIFAHTKFKLLLQNWWRFRFFLRTAIQSLIDIGLGVNYRDDSSEKEHTNVSKSEKLDLSAITILLDIALQFPHLLQDLKIGNDWFVQVLRKSFMEQSHPIHGIIMQILNTFLDSPLQHSREEFHLVIQQILAPISEMLLFSQGSRTELTSNSVIVDACKHSLLSLLNNWEGVFTIFALDSNEQQLYPTSFFRIFDHIGKNTLMTPSIERIHVFIVDFICELLNFPYANKVFNSGSWDDAFKYYRKMRLPDSYNSSLRESFVLAEIDFVNSIQMFNNIDLLKIYRIVIVYALINAGLLEALIRLILQNPDEAVSIKSTFLLADILRLSTNLPQNVRLEALSIFKLVQKTVKAFQAKTLRELAQQKEDQHEGIPSLNDLLFPNDTEKRMDWSSTTKDNYRQSLLLLDRLDRVNDFRNKPITLSDLHLMNTFLIMDIENRRKRGNSILILSRHSSESNDPNDAEDNNVLADQTIRDMDSDLNALIAKAFTFTPCLQQTENIMPMQHQQTVFGQETVKPVWNIIWKILLIIDDQFSFQSKGGQSKSKIIDKCVPTFNQLVQFFLPSNQHFVSTEAQPLSIPCGQLAFHILCIFAKSSPIIGADNAQWASDLLTNFLYDLCCHLNPDNLGSVVSPKNLLCTMSSNYFSILRVLSSNPTGQKLIEQTATGQVLLDRVSGDKTSPELIKLILSSLDYFPPIQTDILDTKNGCIFARNLLENTLHTAKDVTVRKWSTRFLDSFFTLNNLGFYQSFDWFWAIGLAFRQISDPSLKIVQTAVNLLLKWLPFCPEEYKKQTKELLKYACLETLGDLGCLLEVFIFDDLDDESSHHFRKMLKKSLQKWQKSFCTRFVEIIEERVRRGLIQNGTNRGLFCYKRSMDGNFARASNQQSGKKNVNVFCPVHLYGQLARSSYGQQLLHDHKILENLEEILLKFLCNNSQHDESFLKTVKGAIFALAHILANFRPYQSPSKFPISYYTNILHSCIEQSSLNSWLSIRGYAIWAVNIAATGNSSVATILSENGWEFGENDSFPLFGNELSIKAKKESFSSEFQFVMPDSLYGRQSHFPSVSSTISRKCSVEQNQSKFDYTKTTQENTASKFFLPMKRRIFSESETYTIKLEKKNNRSSSINGLKSTNKLSQITRKTEIRQEIGFNYDNLLQQSDDDLHRRPKGHSSISTNEQRPKKYKKRQLMSEKENSALIVYRKLLSGTSESNEKVQVKMIETSSSNWSNDCCSIILPKHIYILFGNVFAENKDKEPSTVSKSDQFYQPSIYTHNKWLCLYCSAKTQGNIDDQSKVNSDIRAVILQHIYSIVNQLSNADTLVKLLSLYKDNPEAFQNKCLFSDALRIIADSRTIGFEGRQLIYQLFWNSI